MAAAQAQALWLAEPGRAELLSDDVPAPGAGEVMVRARYGAISRGSERLVFDGAVPPGEAERMRAPFQAGDFPGPVKYGYATVGDIVDGPAERLGETVFCLHPHQTLFVVPDGAARPVPAGVPPERAVLAAQMETALNALWDAGAAPAERLAVVGGGVVGCLVAYLAAGLPGSQVALIDPALARASLAERLGLAYARPEDAARARFDTVFHASGNPAGLATALALAAFEARVVELSWYGNRAVTAPLGGAFHSQRLQLIASQVGTISPRQRGRFSHQRRLDAALALLADPVLDALIDSDTPFAALPAALPDLLSRDGPARLAPRIVYPAAAT